MSGLGRLAAMWVVAGLVGGTQGLAQEAPPPRPVIQSATLRLDTGTLILSGQGFGPHLLVTVDGQTVTTLPGSTATHLEVQAPASVLTTPGTYRLTIVDPVQRAWDGFVVASAPAATGGGVPVSAGSADGVRLEAPSRTAADPGPGAARNEGRGPVPLAIIEDSGSPWRTAIGSTALDSNTTGVRNTAVGYAALTANTTAPQNTAVGYRSLETNSTGDSNSALGALSLADNTTGLRNTAVGESALSANTTGMSNTALGHEALGLTSITGSNNTAVGAGAGSFATGSHNIFIGALVFGSSADNNTIRIGSPSRQDRAFIAGIRDVDVVSTEAVYINSSGQLGSGPVVPGTNTVGTGALADNAVTAAKVAFNYAASASEGGAATDLACTGCVAASEVGFAFAGLGANVFQGTQTIGTGNLDLDLSSSTEGTITKRGVRFLHDRGTQNTFLGATAGNFTLSGGENTATGFAALSSVSSGFANTSHGSRALGNTTTGKRNTAVGATAGNAVTTGSHNIFLGADVIGTAADANTMRLGLPFNASTGEGQTRTFVAGVAGTVLTTPAVQVFIDANGQLGTLTPPVASGTGTTPAPLSLQEAQEQQAINAAHEATINELKAANAELRARLARLEALVVAGPRRR